MLLLGLFAVPLAQWLAVIIRYQYLHSEIYSVRTAQCWLSALLYLHMHHADQIISYEKCLLYIHIYDNVTW